MSTEDNGRPVLLVGYSSAWLHAVAKFQPDRSVIFIEEPDVARKRRLATETAGSSVLRELIEWEYQLDGAADCFYNRHRELRPAAVVPVVEYAVPFAARLAERYGVVGAGYGAAVVLRDKQLLRTVTAAAGIANPRSVAVAGPAEVRAFMAEVGGSIVLKPANRQASIGTKIVRDIADVEASWAECLDQDEGMFVPDRPMPLRMLAERFVDGQEFSVEMLVRGGRPAFGTVTRKFLFAGARPVEQGHLLPANIDPALSSRLVDGTARVVAAVGMDSGFVHCEWIVENGEPYLVECAGRLPGGWIMDLIEMAWEYGIFDQYWATMRGEELTATPPPVAPRYGAVWLARAPAGQVETVLGLAEARASEGVQVCSIIAEPGEQVHELRSSWDRVAMVLAVGATPTTALANAQQAMAHITIITR